MLLLWTCISLSSFGQSANKSSSIVIKGYRWVYDDTVTVAETITITSDSVSFRKEKKGTNVIITKESSENDPFLSELMSLNPAQWKHIAVQSKTAECDTTRPILITYIGSAGSHRYSITNGEEYCVYPAEISEFMKKLFQLLHRK